MKSFSGLRSFWSDRVCWGPCFHLEEGGGGPESIINPKRRLSCLGLDLLPPHPPTCAFTITWKGQLEGQVSQQTHLGMSLIDAALQQGVPGFALMDGAQLHSHGSIQRCALSLSSMSHCHGYLGHLGTRRSHSRTGTGQSQVQILSLHVR